MMTAATGLADRADAGVWRRWWRAQTETEVGGGSDEEEEEEEEEFAGYEFNR